MKRLSITLVRSPIGRPRRHRQIIQSLGLRRVGHTVIRQDTPEVRGMIQKVAHLIGVSPLEDPEARQTKGTDRPPATVSPRPEEAGSGEQEESDANP